MGMQSPSTPPVLTPTLLLGSPIWDQRLAISIYIYLSLKLVEPLRRHLYYRDLVYVHGIDSKLNGFWIASIFVPTISLGRKNFCSKFLIWIGGPIPHLGYMSSYWTWSLQVQSPHFWQIQPMASIVSGIFYRFSTPPSHTAIYFYSFFWASVLLSFLPQYLILPPFSFPVSLRFLLPSLCFPGLFCAPY